MLDYRHLVKMTDDIGILQFSKYNKPDVNSGHTLDDNARALMVALTIKNDSRLALTYATWLKNAVQADGTWSNILLNGVYSSRFDSEDSIGRTLLACSLGARSPWRDVANICENLLEEQVDKTRNFTSPRAIAYSLVALCKNHDYDYARKYEELINELADKLINLFMAKKSNHWAWFEDYLTYCNGILPHAMFSYYAVSGDKKGLKIGHSSLDFLNNILFRKGYLNIIGNDGWYHRGGKIPLFDQQPVDATSIIFACMEAYHTIGETKHLELATLAYQWFRGKNVHSLSLYNENTGGCFDALTADGLNLNQGAESSLSLLLADTLMVHSIQQEDISIDKTS
ncbi:MAG TPA: hypothetical protein VFC73_00235 [Syntrophomonadaceae bacterium]|nr:hypothetical protein [Syntrophomonadaceae bacterium]